MNISIGSTSDISLFLCFILWQPIYCMDEDSDFTSYSTEERRSFSTIFKSVGHYMTFKIFTDKSKKVINSSNVRPDDIPLDKNIRL